MLILSGEQEARKKPMRIENFSTEIQNITEGIIQKIKT